MNDPIDQAARALALLPQHALLQCAQEKAVTIWNDTNDCAVIPVDTFLYATDKKKNDTLLRWRS